jgi:hypothetical protein
MLTYNLEGVDEDGVQPEELKARPPRAARPLVRNVLAVLGLVAIFFGVLLVRNWRADSNARVVTFAADARVMPSSPEIEDKYGVRFLGVDVTSGGGMIQVRYQVLDSAKTEAIHSQEATPAVIDGGGVKYDLPGMAGHSHIGPVKKAGVTDFVLLANAGGGVKSGSIVTIKIGELELHDVPVS